MTSKFFYFVKGKTTNEESCINFQILGINRNISINIKFSTQNISQFPVILTNFVNILLQMLIKIIVDLHSSFFNFF